jgi:hypothetical protein
VEAFGTSAVYATAAAVCLVPLACMLGVPDVRQRGERPALSLADLRAGARTAWHHPWLKLLLIVTGLGWALINTFFVLEPLFVKETLLRSTEALYYLWAAHGAGALVSAVILARTKRGAGHEPAIILAGVVTVGVGILVYAAVGDYGVALVAAAVQGAGFAMFFPPLFALIQRVVAEEQRGRVTSVFVALQEFMGLVSSLLIFGLGTWIVVRPTLIGAGIVLAVFALAGLRSFVGARGAAELVVDEGDEPAA